MKFLVVRSPHHVNPCPVSIITQSDAINNGLRHVARVINSNTEQWLARSYFACYWIACSNMNGQFNASHTHLTVGVTEERMRQCSLCSTRSGISLAAHSIIAIWFLLYRLTGL